MTARHANTGEHQASPLSAETAEKLRALVKALAREAAEADYREHQHENSPPPKGSDS